MQSASSVLNPVGDRLIIVMGFEQDTVSFSVVVPTYNEEASISSTLDSILSAHHPTQDLEILVVDGRSKDSTREIVRKYTEQHTSISLYDNPNQDTPDAINIGFEQSSGDIVVLVGGHSTVPRDFFTGICQAFDCAPQAGVVGGLMEPSPSTYFETGVAIALTTPIGASSKRFSEYEGYVDTVNYGAYKRETIEKVGLMNTSLPRAQDYEYNRRARNEGIKIYQYPSISVKYKPRSNPRTLASQYFGSGYWKTLVFREYDYYPISPTISAIGFLIVATMAVIITPVALAITLYLILLFYSTVSNLHRVESAKIRHIPASITALMIMHSAFACGLLSGSLRKPRPDSE